MCDIAEKSWKTLEILCSFFAGHPILGITVINHWHDFDCSLGLLLLDFQFNIITQNYLKHLPSLKFRVLGHLFAVKCCLNLPWKYLTAKNIFTIQIIYIFYQNFLVSLKVLYYSLSVN